MALMRIWDLPLKKLCRPHLLAEHRELHAIWSVIVNGKKGYARHPEVLRWRGRLRALYLRHQAQVTEFGRRGWRHQTKLDARRASGSGTQNIRINTLAEQRLILRRKKCRCFARPGF